MLGVLFVRRAAEGVHLGWAWGTFPVLGTHLFPPCIFLTGCEPL